QLARRQREYEGHQHALAFDSAHTTRFEVLLEENAFVGDVLIDQPEAFSVHGDDETGADLTERLEISDFVGMRKTRWRVRVRRREICSPLRSGGLQWWYGWFAEGYAGLERKALLDGTKRRGRGEIESAVGANARTDRDLFHSWDDCARNSGRSCGFAGGGRERRESRVGRVLRERSTSRAHLPQTC